MDKLQFAVLTPSGYPDPSLAIAASRFGALGVLDLEYCPTSGAMQQAVAQLSRYAPRPFGARLRCRQQDLLGHLLDTLPDRLDTLLLVGFDPQALRHQIEAIRSRERRILIEVLDVETARLAEAMGVDGLVVKGNEAGGFVSQETTFVLLQRCLAEISLPIFAQGGIGLHTAAACYAAGAAGVVLDSQLALARESQLPAAVKTAVASMDGSETLSLGAGLGLEARFSYRPGFTAVDALHEQAVALEMEKPAGTGVDDRWRQAVADRVGWGAPAESVWLLGQDVAFASSLAERYHTVGGILAAMQDAVEGHVSKSAQLRPLSEHGPLARSHHTRYPIVQGPMTRVSDRAEFCAQVAASGALPFLALALMREREVDALLKETKDKLGESPWGVGILGFVPLELRQEQLAAVRRYRPPFAIIAGGRPDQAMQLEQDGIKTYLHVPSPGMLQLFLEDGARRFIFEGRECGGHVGPRSSFVLWDSMIDVLLANLSDGDASSCHVLFAGGIHDSLSAVMVAAMAAPLAERGVRMGVLMGTAYLFTQEAVASGAILPGFQEAAIECANTVLLESGPGHATRCVPTPFIDVFQQEKLKLLREGRASEEVRQELEVLNVGRLRIASKGITRHPRYGQDPDAPKYETVAGEDQRREGLYMIGQVAALRKQVVTLAELHSEVSIEGMRRLAGLTTVQPRQPAELGRQPAQIAIVGIGAIVPSAQNLQQFWENVLNSVYAIGEVPKERWDADLYFDPDRNARDKIYSKWGGFLADVPFDPLEFGIPPNSLASIDPMHLLALVVAKQALADAGYETRPFDRSRTSVILGASGGVGDLGAAYVLRSGLPLLFGQQGFDLATSVGDRLPEWTEDSFAGLLLNVTAGRIANRLDFGGLNYTVDAACASSLTAVHLAVKELETHNTDIVVAGGVDTAQNPFSYMCFSKTQALSPTGEPRVFDATGDGIVIGEGVVMLILKRLADAEHDGDRIYAVIQSVDGASDGRALGLTAPRPEGQVLALQRAYDKAGFSPTTVGLFEAHGTGTVVGDRTEALSLTRFLESHNAASRTYAIGSIKSMIGHTKATAGVAGLAKVALSLYHKILPPTLGVHLPNPKARLGDGPLYVNSEARPWIQGSADHPRRAGVSAFGFGGTNFHAVLEEYQDDYLAQQRVAPAQGWPSELFLWTAESRDVLADALGLLEDQLAGGAQPQLRDLAYTLWMQQPVQGSVRLAIVASSLEDLRQKIETARTTLRRPDQAQLSDPRGIYLRDGLEEPAGKVAFLFPGQGSQYPNMVRDLAIHFDEVRETFELADKTLAQRFPRPLSSYIFPVPAFSPAEEKENQAQLTETNVAQPALGTADLALYQLLRRLGIRPDLVAGHSYGEYAALCAGGAFDLATLFVLSEARGRSIVEAAEQDLGTMAAVRADAATIRPIVEPVAGVWIANLNAPRQTIISGTKEGIAEALQRLQEQGITGRPIPVACAFHSPLVAPAQARLSGALEEAEFVTPAITVYGNAIAGPYPDEPSQIRSRLAEHLVLPVRFADEIEAMYQAGARLFIEVGPRNVLTGLVDLILGDRWHVAIQTDWPGRHGLSQLQHALGQLAVHGVPMDLERLFARRQVRLLSLANLVQASQPAPLSPSTWLVNGSGMRPAHGPKPVPQRPPLEGVAFGNGLTSNGGQRPSAAAPASLAQPSQPPTSIKAEGQAVAPVRQAHNVAPAGVPGDDEAQVMSQFQNLMGSFLETQRTVMLTYLQGSAGVGVATAALVVSPATLPFQESAITQAAVQAALVASEVEASTPAAAVEASEEPEAAQVTAGAAADLPSKVQLAQHLLHIVSERTGYPAEMLQMNVDIEARLGIDSIKRVEILGVLQRKYVPADRRVGPEAMEQLTAIKTLQGVVDWFDDALRGVLVAQALPPVLSADPALDTIKKEIPRFKLVLVDAPAVTGRTLIAAPGRVFLITDDGRGVATQVADQLRFLGVQPVLLRMGAVLDKQGDSIYQVDLGNACAVDQVVAQVRHEIGPIAGLVHLAALGESADFRAMSVAEWRERQRHDVKSLFYLAKAAAGDLKQAVGEKAGAWLLAASGMGGAFAMEDAAGYPLSPSQAGLAGLVKTLALEWPGVSCKAVDLNVQSSPELLAQQVMAELAAADGLVQVGYDGQRRRTLQPVLAPLSSQGSHATQLAVEPDWVILINGGARGITAEVAIELAERYRPTILLVGSSTPPAPQEEAATAGLSSPQEVKGALIDRLKQEGRAVTIEEVEGAYHRLVKAREMRQNLDRMRRAGSTVRYYQADVRDAEALAALIGSVYAEFGRLDGVIHGAGIIEDKLVEDKTPESFDRVFDTKADSAFVLARTLRPESLKFMAMFSSAAGAFGNRGQSDYAATNEVLNKLALVLDRDWPGRVVSLNWGPWLKTGMVGQELQRQFAERGILLITIDAGRKLFEEEIRLGRKGDVEVILAGGEWGGTAEPASKPQVASDRSFFPLLIDAEITNGTHDQVEVIRTLDPASDLYLRDHVLDGKPVFPLAMAMEWMAETAQCHWPEYRVASLQELSVLRGVILESGPRRVRLTASLVPHAGENRHSAALKVEISDHDQPAHVHYRATVELTTTPPMPQVYHPPFANGAKPFDMSVPEAYDRWLFHGPFFQAIKQIQEISDNGMTAVLTPSSPRAGVANAGASLWMIDPAIFDAGLQMVILWSRAHLDATPLPARFRRYRRFDFLSGSRVVCHLHVTSRPSDHLFFIDLAFLDENGRLLGLLEDMECPTSKALNRLASADARVLQLT